ncbi:MAG: alpha-L-fucosidase [Clostridia bacterium]|nr:alpha-L-fucosidase [Clostridia bacterium]
MIVKQYIKDFEKLGFGMFVHFGLYSVLGRGEWIKHQANIPQEEYEKCMKKFKVNKTWAKELVKNAKNAGCKYITITTRHHDGFSLYDTCGMNEYDAPHSAAGRDLIREFVDECNKADIIPFFYHTLIDWYNPLFETDFKAYLKYLRDSVEILCTRYGKIGGLWFDGWWAKPNDDWEEDALYGLIRKYQPEAMIINNTGMGDNMGKLGHIEIDSLTYERGKPSPMSFENCPKYVAREMCQIFGTMWGYMEQDLSYKPVSEMLENLIFCRRNKANLLLNVGPMANGMLCDIDKGYLQKLGIWTKLHDPAIRDVDEVVTEISTDTEFLMYDNANKCHYLFIMNPNGEDVTVAIDKDVKSVTMMDNGWKLDFVQQDGKLTFNKVKFEPGYNLVYRVARID